MQETEDRIKELLDLIDESIKEKLHSYSIKDKEERKAYLQKLKEKDNYIVELFVLLEKSSSNAAKIPSQSCYDLYCDILNKKKNPFTALAIAYELGKYSQMR